jgi:hypothetical protein
MSFHSTTCLQNFGGQCDCGGDGIPKTLRFALCKHDTLLSGCEGCALQRIAQLEAELAEARRECEWPRYKRLAEENGNSARAFETALDAERAAHARTQATLEALTDASRSLVTCKDHLSFGLNKSRVLDALAAVGEKEGKR